MKQTIIVTLLVCLLVVYTVHAQQPFDWIVCKEYPSQTLQLSSISMLPNPPQTDHLLEMAVRGTLTSPMGIGATGNITVYYSGATMYSGPFDPCQYLQDSDTPCPLAKGPISISILKRMSTPPGPYAGTIRINDENKKLVTCINFIFQMV